MGLAVLLALGCGKDNPKPDNNQPEPQDNFKSCRLITFDTGTAQYSFAYNSQGKISQVLSTHGDVETYEYNALGKVSRFLVLRSGIDTTTINTYEYNADSLVSKSTTKARPGSSGPFTTLSIQSFLYDSQKKIVGMNYHDVNQPAVIKSKYSYTHLSNGDVQIQVYDLDPVTNSWEYKSEIMYTFDNHKLPRGDNDIFKSIFPHNKLSLTVTPFTNGVPGPTTFESVSHTYNAVGYPTQSISTIAGQPARIWKYTYTCQ